jgi:membrane associated rhomboid family serine protease
VDKRIMPARLWPAVLLIGAFTALLYAVAVVDHVLTADLVQHGIAPRSLSGLDGILWAPLLHVGWWSLIGSTLPVVVLGFLVTAGGLRQWAAVTATIWLTCGVGVWLISDHSVTVGVMGVGTGWLMFLLVRGIATRGFLQLAIAGALMLYWGGILLLAVPSERWISWRGDEYWLSWQSHLFGAVGGLLAVWLVTRANRTAKVASVPLLSREE